MKGPDFKNPKFKFEPMPPEKPLRETEHWQKAVKKVTDKSQEDHPNPKEYKELMKLLTPEERQEFTGLHTAKDLREFVVRKFSKYLK